MGSDSDFLLRLHTKAGASPEQDDFVARIGYGQWARIRLESDLVGTTADGHARLKVLTTNDPLVDQTLPRVIPSVTDSVSVVGIYRSGVTTTATVEADFDNVVGGTL